MKLLHEFPTLKWWQRILKRLVGGQDIVAVVYIVYDNGVNSSNISWFMGVNMEEPINVERSISKLGAEITQLNNQTS